MEATPLEKSISMGIVNPFMNDTDNWMDSIIQPDIVHFKQATGLVQIDRNHFPISSLNSGI